MFCPVENCDNKLELNIWILLDQREASVRNANLGYILCSDCANKYMPKSGYPLYKPRLRYGWRTVTLGWVRKYLEREWDGNRERTYHFIRELQKKIARKRSRTPKIDLTESGSVVEEPACKKSKSVTTNKRKTTTTKKPAMTQRPFPLLAEVRQQTQLLKEHTAMMADLVGGLLQVCKTMSDRLVTIDTSTMVNAQETQRLKDVQKEILSRMPK